MKQGEHGYKQAKLESARFVPKDIHPDPCAHREKKKSVDQQGVLSDSKTMVPSFVFVYAE